ncbi:MAG: radical SAM/SPASM domain-containing protein [Pyrobaculum sp.]
MFFVTSIVFLYTYKCNFKCRHCSIGSGPQHNSVLPINYVDKAIREASEVASIQVIAFSGGEPTLFPKHLEFGIRLSSELGLIPRLVTNAWWARSLEVARRYVKKWRELGLEELNISFDDFHLEYLQLFGGEQNVVNAVKAALEEGLRVAISVTKTYKSRITGKYLRKFLGEYADKVIIVEDFISPTGRASPLFDETGKELPPIGGCAYTGSEISIHPNGDVAFCCGHIITDPASAWFTRVGDITKEHLWDVVDRIQRNVLIWYIRFIGPHVLVKKFNEEEEAKHICHACHLLATKYWKELETRGKKWIINDLKKEIKGLNVRVLAK